MSEEEFLNKFVEFCNKLGYGSSFNQKSVIPKFLEQNKLIDKWMDKKMEESRKNPLSNLDMFFAVHNEPKDEIWMVNKRTMKVVGRLRDVIFESQD